MQQQIKTADSKPKPYWRRLLSIASICMASQYVSAQSLSPAEAADSARQYTEGKVLKVKPITGQKVHYRVKVLSPEGRIHYLVIDGDNGTLHPRPPKKKNRRKHQKASQKSHYTETGL